MTDDKPNALTRPSPVVPKTFDEVWRFAQVAVKSGATSTNSPEQAFYCIQFGMEMGLTPMKAVQSLHLISGKVTMSADLQVALCLGDSRCAYFECRELTDRSCTYAAKRADKGGNEQTFTFTMQDAHTAGLVRKGGNWEKYPKAMLKARASSALARQVFPDIVMGIYDPEEIQSIGTAEVVEPVVEPTEPEKVAVETREHVGAEMLRDRIADLTGAYWPEFYEALTVAAGKEPTVGMLVKLVDKLEGLDSDIARDEYAQEQIDKYLNQADFEDAEYEEVK